MESLGFVIGIAFLVGIIVLGLQSLTLGLRTRSQPDLVLGAVFLIAAILIVVTAAHRFSVEAAVEWNPQIESDAQILGRWEEGERTLDIREDGSFTFTSGSVSHTGGWKRADWNLSLVAPNFEAQYGVVRYGDEMRLLEAPADGESWNYWDGLQRIGT